jgi:hypothetical protein
MTMSKCGKYWQKVDEIDNEIKDVKKQLADVERQLLSQPINPLPHLKHKQALEDKNKNLAKKYASAHLAAVNCEAKAHQGELKKEK